jgi:aspartyl-tRNA synthetase
MEEDKSCLLRGWVEDIRPLGKIAFFTIRDITGLAQVVINKNVVGEETFNLAMSVSRQSIIEVDGKVKKSRSENIPKEVLAEKFRVLSRSNPPFPIDPTGRVF